MKGILKMNEKNQYYIWDKEDTKSYNLSELINTYRNDKIIIHIEDGYDCRLKDFTQGCNLKGYIASQKVGKQIYDDYIVDEEELVQKANNDDIEGMTNVEGFDLTDWLFNNVDEMIEIHIKIAKDTEREGER